MLIYTNICQYLISRKYILRNTKIYIRDIYSLDSPITDRIFFAFSQLRCFLNLPPDHKLCSYRHIIKLEFINISPLKIFVFKITVIYHLSFSGYQKAYRLEQRFEARFGCVILPRMTEYDKYGINLKVMNLIAIKTVRYNIIRRTAAACSA